MSGSPYNGQGQGQGSNPPAFNPALLNANAALANFSPNYNNLAPSPFPTLAPTAQIPQQGNFRPEQLAQLTEYHRQSSQQRVASTQAQTPMLGRSQLAMLSIMPAELAHVLMQQRFAPERLEQILQQWGQTEQGKLAIEQARANASSLTSSSGLDTISSPGQVFGRQATASPSSRLGVLGSPQMPQSRSLGITSSPDKVQSTLQSPGQSSSKLPESRRSPKKPDVPITQAFIPASLPNDAKPLLPPMSTPAGLIKPDVSFRPAGAPAPPPSYSNVQWIRPSSSSNADPAPRTAPPRRREEGMRGSMRSELSRLMYASGDVENPEIDTIDYMEDMVVDWLAELCTPPPPVRSGPSAPLVAPRLDYNVIRHRLSRPSMRKYLDRFEYMEYKAIDMRSARRVARGNFEPVDQKDLDRQLEDGFLDGEDSGQVGPAAKRKRKYQRGQGPAQQGTGTGPGVGEGEKEKERKKPGPKKGWRAGLGDEAPKGRKYKRARQGTAQSASSGRGPSVKPEES